MHFINWDAFAQIELRSYFCTATTAPTHTPILFSILLFESLTYIYSNRLLGNVLFFHSSYRFGPINECSHFILLLRPFSNLIPLSRIKFLCFHCQYRTLGVCVCLHARSMISFIHIRLAVSTSLIFPSKLLYQRVAFVFHFNFTNFLFYIDFECETLSGYLNENKKKRKRKRRALAWGEK